VLYFIGVWKSFSREPIERIPVNNASGGLLKILIDPFLSGDKHFEDIVLVSEPNSICMNLTDHVEKNITCDQKYNFYTLEAILGVDWGSQESTYDLCERDIFKTPGIKGFVDQGFDLIITQSLLEHVVNPYQVLCNLLELRKDAESVLAVHTNNSFMRLHRFPIDTLRFFPDFFEEFAKKQGLELIVSNSGASIFAFFANSFDRKTLKIIKDALNIK
jgi:hypothetical protein